MSEVSSEAVEARESLAKRLARDLAWHGPWEVYLPTADWVLAHQPARVVPSAEEVRAGILGVLPGIGDPDGMKRATAEAATRTVLALFASQPTVAQVREQVARELEALLPTDDEVADPQPCSAGHDCHEAARYVTVRRAQRIARGETKGGE